MTGAPRAYLKPLAESPATVIGCLKQVETMWKVAYLYLTGNTEDTTMHWCSYELLRIDYA